MVNRAAIPDTLVATSMSHDHSCFQDEVIKPGQ